MTTSLRILSCKADSYTWESFTRSELKLESLHQESPRSDIFRKRATKPLLKQKHRQKHLTWAKEKKNWTVAQWSNRGLHGVCAPVGPNANLAGAGVFTREEWWDLTCNRNGVNTSS